jgi:hypothetical protein
MQIESLESRTFLSADGNTVTVPLKDSVSGNLAANLMEGTVSHLGKMTGAFDATGKLVFTAANGDELWIQPVELGPKDGDPMVWHVEALIIGGTGRFEGASGAGSHDVFFQDVPGGNYVFEAETMVTLQRPWNSPA